jgi:hypothetical protein
MERALKYPASPNSDLDSWLNSRAMVVTFNEARSMPLTSSGEYQELVDYQRVEPLCSDHQAGPTVLFNSMQWLAGRETHRLAYELVQRSSLVLQEVVLCVLEKCPVSEVPKLHEPQDRVFSIAFSQWAWRFLDAFLVQLGLSNLSDRKQFHHHASDCLPDLFDKATLAILEAELQSRASCEAVARAAVSNQTLYKRNLDRGVAPSFEDMQTKFFVEGAVSLKVQIRPLARSRRGNAKKIEGDSLPEYLEYTEESLSSLIGYELNPDNKRNRKTSASAATKFPRYV